MPLRAHSEYIEVVSVRSLVHTNPRPQNHVVYMVYDRVWVEMWAVPPVAILFLFFNSSQAAAVRCSVATMPQCKGILSIGMYHHAPSTTRILFSVSPRAALALIGQRARDRTPLNTLVSVPLLPVLSRNPAFLPPGMVHVTAAVSAAVCSVGKQATQAEDKKTEAAAAAAGEAPTSPGGKRRREAAGKGGEAASAAAPGEEEEEEEEAP